MRAKQDWGSPRIFLTKITIQERVCIEALPFESSRMYLNVAALAGIQLLKTYAARCEYRRVLD